MKTKGAVVELFAPPFLSFLPHSSSRDSTTRSRRSAMASVTPGGGERNADANWAGPLVAARPELWALIAPHLNLVEAFRLKTVCRASREGATEGLRTLPGLVVCGGLTPHREGGWRVYTSEVLRLDLGELRWERMPSLTRGRCYHACCAVRGGVVVLGGDVEEQDESGEHPPNIRTTASVEILGGDSVLPPLSCGPIFGAVALPIEESESELGQVLLIGGWNEDGEASSAVHKVDLATGVCTPQPSLLTQHGALEGCTAARLPDGRIVCVGWNENSLQGTAQVLEPPPPPEHGSLAEASWQWRYLPGMSVGRSGGRGCVLSDSRFAVFGGYTGNSAMFTASCEVLTLDGAIERWDPLPPMHEAREGFACAAIGGCVIVAGGHASITVEVYEEALGRWRRLPCNLPHDGRLDLVGSALMM
jgi:hypothetical protein